MNPTNTWPEHIDSEADCYFHDVLTPRKKMHVEQHVKDCEPCRIALAEARKRFEATKNVTASEPSDALLQKTLAKITAHEDARRRRFKLIRRASLGALAAMVLFALGGWIYYLNLGPSPYELRILGPVQLAADSDASLRVWVMHHDKGQGVEKVPVKIELGDEKGNNVVELVSFDTDVHGTGDPVFHLPAWKDGDYQLRVTAKPGGAPQVLTQNVSLKRHWKLMLSSDRPIYKPGQTIHVRSLALAALDLRPAVGQGVVFRVVDPKGNVVFKHKEVASKFGIASADCVLADEILEGLYTLQCQLGDGPFATSQEMKVQVQKYVLPRFKIAVTFDKPYFQPGQRIAGKVKAEYFFGKPIGEKDGLIELLLSKDPAKPETMQRLSLPPGPGGETVFSFAPPAESLLAGASEATLELAVRVTDSAGQVETRKTPVILTKEPLRIEVVPEAGSLVRGLQNKVFVLVTSADGKPAKARVMISGIDKELTTDERGSALFQFAPTKESVAWTIRAQDDQGLTGRREVTLSCSQNPRDFIVRTDKAVYESGGEISLEWDGFVRGEKNEMVFVDVVKEGQCLASHAWLPTQEAKIQLAADWFGTLRLRAYRLKGQHIVAERTRVVYVQPPGKVRIATTMDKTEYSPGGRARLDFLLKDPDGKPLPGALSLAVVDESVFAVMEQNESPTAFFTWDTQTIQAPGSTVSWSPDSISKDTAKDRQLYEQALFARTSEAAGQARAAGRFDASSYVANVREAEARLKAFSDATRWWWVFFANFLGIAAVVVVIYGLGKLIVSMKTASAQGWMFFAVGTFLVMITCITAFTALGTNGNKTFTNVSNTLANVGGFADEPATKQSPFQPPLSFTEKKDLLRDLQAQGASNIIVYSTKDKKEDLGKTHHGLNFEPGAAQSAPPPRIRDWFPETLHWRPELITDNDGHAQLHLDLADSITTWRLTTSAVTGDGRLGASRGDIKVFQPFFVDVKLPLALTRGDEVAVPVVVYSYIDKAQEVVVKLADADWFERLEDQAEKRVSVGANDVKATHFRLRARKVGKHELHLTATGAAHADAIKRQIEVSPEGRAVELAFNGVLSQPVQLDLDVPDNAIPDSAKLLLKIYPSAFSQVLEGLDSIFRMPSGCFEQTSSTTYPNVLALDYLNRTKTRVPEVEKVKQKAKGFIHLGYQRLLGFEVPGGGFDWFGRPPANRTLTAYGLMEFRDMAQVHDVDPRLIERTRAWLLAQRQADGSWQPEGHVPANLPGSHLGGDKLARLSTTAYVAWAVFSHAAGRGTPSPAGNPAPDMDSTHKFLLQHPADQIDDPHVLGLVALALLAMDDAAARPYLDRLESLKKATPDAKQIYWQQGAGQRTTFYGAGRSGEVETTALATLALMQAHRSPGTVAAALSWIGSQRDAAGTWYSTQATVLALKALLAGNDIAADPNGSERRIRLTFADGQEKTITIAADQAEVMAQQSLTGYLRKGANRLTLTDLNSTRPGYQVVLRYHEPAPKKQHPGEPFVVQVRYGKDAVKIGDLLPVKATVRNEQKEKSPMVMVELPIPAGFDVELDGWSKLVEQNRIAKFQLQPGKILVYLRDLDAGQSLELPFGLRAKMAARIQVPAARVYEYYNPARSAASGVALLVIGEP